MSETIGHRVFTDPWVVLPAIVLATFFAAYLSSMVGLRFLKPAIRKLPPDIDIKLYRLFEKHLFPLMFIGGLLVVIDASPLPPNILRASHVLIRVAAILLVVLFATKGALLALGSFAARSESMRNLREPAEALTKITFIVLGAMIILDNLGIAITPLITTLGVGSLAVAIALQDTLSNLFAGLYIRADSPVQVGHYVRLQTGEEGYVDHIGWRNTRVRMLPNNMVIVPNSKLLQSNITNFYLPQKELAVLVEVGARYDSDLEKVEKVTCAVAKEVLMTVPGGVASFEPFIRYHTFNQSSIDFTVILRGQEFTDAFLIKHEFIKKLHFRYRQEGIEIPFPVRAVHMQSGDGDHHENGAHFERAANRRRKFHEELKDPFPDKEPPTSQFGGEKETSRPLR